MFTTLLWPLVPFVLHIFGTYIYFQETLERIEFFESCLELHETQKYQGFFPHTEVTFFLRTVVRTTVQMFVLVRSLVPVYRYDVPVLQSLAVHDIDLVMSSS